jgi:hypothetical protein
MRRQKNLKIRGLQIFLSATDIRGGYEADFFFLGGISAPQCEQGTVWFFLSAGTICVWPHLGQVRLSPLMVPIMVEIMYGFMVRSGGLHSGGSGCARDPRFDVRISEIPFPG